MGLRWRNWSRNVHTSPVEVYRPRDVAEVAAVISRARREGRRLKVVGAGHSFPAIGAAYDIQLDLCRLRGIVAEEGGGCIRVRAGTTLRQLNAELAGRGWALTNLGDIDSQTIAGALATGTHGTGHGFGGLASQLRGMEIVTGTGEVCHIGDDSRGGPPLEAMAVHLGALGVVTEVTLQCVPAFTLHAVEDQARLSDVLTGLTDHFSRADHVEFYWFPYTDRCLTKSNTRRPGQPVGQPLPRWRQLLDDELLSNGVFQLVNSVGRLVPQWVPAFNAVSARALSYRAYEAPSHGVFVTNRRVRFVETEYAVPREALGEVLAELGTWVQRNPQAAVQFPVEVRCAAADDQWLSMAYGRETAYVAAHQYHRSAFVEYFRAVADIAGRVGGRPHWGKLHDLSAPELAERYPRMSEFLALRDELDPQRVFANPYLTRVLGP